MRLVLARRLVAARAQQRVQSSATLVPAPRQTKLSVSLQPVPAAAAALALRPVAASRVEHAPCEWTKGRAYDGTCG